jgi:gentisate 1,2-dioxygenase
MADHPALGTVEELPSEYRATLEDLKVVPAWTVLRGVMPLHKPAHQAEAVHWRYRDVRPQLLRAGQLVPVEKAERRVLALVNPGYSPDRLATLPSIFFGLQLIMPGERAPNHRHIPAAARIIIEGEGAYTTVEGEKIRMDVGDLILTPPHHWHDHGHEGKEPVIWMDVLDHPLAVPLDISYSIPGKLADSYSNTPDSGETYYRCAGLVPYRGPSETPPAYPLRRFRWSRVREALDAVAEASARDEPVHLRYVNPETGESVLKTLDFSARLLRAGERVSVPKSSANIVIQVMSGSTELEVNGTTYRCNESDTVAIPTYAELSLSNRSSKAPCYLIQVDDVPTQSKLGFYEKLDS